MEGRLCRRVSNLLDGISRTGIERSWIDSSQEFMEVIKRLKLPRFEVDDKLLLMESLDGQFSTKSGYFTICKEIANPRPNGMWKKLWKLKMHERLKIFIWRLFSKVLPTKDNI